MKDVYISGFTDRVSPEAPVPIVRVSGTEFKAGGAANVALNAASLGLKVTLLSLVGDDESAEEIEKLLSLHKIKCIFIKSANLRTIQKHRIISQNQQILRLDYESQIPKLNYTPENYSKLLKKFTDEINTKTYSAIILSDYKKGVLGHCANFITSAKEISLPVFVDPKGKDFSIYEGSTFLKPNLKEFENVVGLSYSKSEFDSKAKKLKKILNIENLLITKGRAGMTLYQKGGNPINIAATNSKEVFDVTGAGDTVLAAVVAAYTSEFSMFDSVKIANMSAGIVVSKFGTAFVNSKELKTIFEKSLEKPFSKSVQNKRALNSAITNEVILKKTLSNMTEIGVLLDYAKRNKKKLVFTNGCFDVLHAGHIHLFKESRKFGNLLVVAINNDASVRILKGKSRPINCINNRIEVLKSIQFIDFIIAFSEETPERLIKIIKPHCLVKGGDYMDKNIVGSEFVKGYGGNVKIVPLVKDLSTTQILKQKK